MSDEIYIPKPHRVYNDAVYHTDRSCGNMPDDFVTKGGDWLGKTNRDWRECKQCSGEMERPGTGRTPLRELVKEGKIDG